MKPGGGIAIILGKSKGMGMGKDMPMHEPDPGDASGMDDAEKGRVASAKAVLAAIEAKDATALSSALEDHYAQCGE